MFEAHVLHLLRRYLGEYVHGLSQEALQISVWKGDVVLKDLQLKAEALNTLKLPIVVKAGFLGSITLKVPWKRLGKEPVIVLIDRVFVLAEPANNDYSFMADDKERIFAAKRQKIEEAELAMLEARDRRKAKEESTQDTNSWFGSLIATIVGNLKISITNVHIRYEDIVSNTGHPFCFGITLAKLAAVTTDEDGKETFDTSGAWDKLCKSLQLERFSVYHNSNTSPWKLDKPWDTLRSDEWSEIFEAGIAETPVKDGHQYLLHPVNGNLKYFRLGRQEKRDESAASQKMSLTVNDVSLTVTENQYRDGIKLLEGVSRYRARVEVSHLRPTVSVTKNPQAWWIYARQASLHQQNKMGLCRQHLSWKNVSRLCHLRRKYVQLYSTLLQQLPRVENKEILEIEKELDAKVILLWRLLAHARVESVRSKELALERERARKSSWWNFGWGSTPKDVDASSISEISPRAVEEIPGQLTKDEWKKLNELLGYDPSEDLIAFPDNELPSTVQISIDATIGLCAARIVNENDIEIICGKFENLQVGLKLYPKSMHCIVRLMSYGVSAPEGSLVQSIVNENNDYALTTAFVYSPIGENLDWKLSARMASCHIMVSMISIERWLQFIRRNNSLSPEVASETATALQLKLEKVTRRAQEHLQLVLEEQSRFSLDIDVDAPKVRIPFTGPTCAGSCSQLLVDFGHFRLCTMNENEVHTQSSSLYRRYLISGRDTTAFFIDGSFEWTNLTQIQFHSMHTEASCHQGPTGAFKLIPIIDKCGMCAMIDQIKVRHPSYPSLQVAIEVPNLGVHFSPARYSRISDLLTMFGSNDCGEDKPGGTGYFLGFSSCHPTDLEDDARVLFWGGIGNSVPEWKSCWLALSGSYLYVFESKASPTYQRCCSMNGRQVMEIPSVYVGGAEFTLAMSIRGSDLQKALESTSTVVLQFKDDNTKAKWLKSLVQATYKASAPMSMCIPGDSGDDSEDESSQSVDASHKIDLFVIGSLVEMKLLVYGKVEDKIDSGDEGMLLEVIAGGGKVRVTQEGGDLTVTMKLHTLMIEDKVQGSVSRTSKYIACSVLDDQSHEIFEEMCDACSPMSTPSAWEEDDNFKDALTDFNSLSESGGVLSSNSVPSTPRETINKLAVEIGQVNGEDDDQSGFVCVTLATKQPDSPSYEGIDTQMLIRMAKLDFFCNRSTVVSLIDFGMELSELTEKSYSTPGLQSALEMNSLGTADNKYANERSVVKGLLGIGKSRIVFQLKMNVDSVCIYLNKEDGSQLAMLVQQKFQLDLKVHPSSVSIEGLLGNLRICDMSNGPCHCWGWLCDIRDAKCDSLVKWKFQSFSRGDDDYEGYDYCFIGKLSAVRIVFLYRFVQEVLVYFYGLATPQAQQVIQVVDKVGGMEWLIQQSDIEGSSALKLDVCLDAPVIIMPEDSTSKNFIQFDLGYLKLSNNFEWHGGNENEPSAVHLDVLNAQITDMNMIVGIDGQLGKPMIQEACGLHLTVSRSLRDIFKRVPEVAIDIKIEMLHGVMSDKEYKIILDCIFSNISEEPHLVPNIRTIPEKTLNTFDVERNSMKSTQDLTACEDQKSSLEGSSYTLSFWTVEIESASLDLYTGMDRESSLAQMNLQGLWVAYRTSSLSEVDLYVTLSKLSILDIRPATKAEMRLMLGSVTDVERDESQRNFQVRTESSTPSLTMLVVDWRVKQDSQALVIRMQQPCVLVVLDFILAVGEYFVPSLGAVTGREDTMDFQNDPLMMHDHIRLNTSFYEQKEEIVYLSSQRKLVADAYHIDEFTYDGCGHTICLVDNVVSKGSSSAKPQPVIVIGYGKNLILKNVRIQNASRLRDCIYLSCESSFSASMEDKVIIDSSDMTDKELKTLTLTNRDAEEGSNAVPERYANNFIVELQAVAPELTFYDSTKWSSDSNWKGERFLRAKLDINVMYAAKDNDRWIRAFVKGLTVDSGTGLAVLDPMDISGEYSCVQDKHNISVVSTDMYIHLSLSVLRLLLRLQDETAAALQFGSANALSFCTHFDKIWSYKQSQSGDDSSQHITIWRPRPPSNYAILGDCITIGHVPPSQAVMAVSKTYGRVKKPLGFKLIWSFLCVDSLETELEISDEDLYCSLWMPVAPEGYTAVGCVGGIGKTPPSTSIVHCIRSDLLTSSKFSDCLFMMHHDERSKNDFSIWRIENSFGSFIGHASVKPPMRTVMCDLREMLRQQINSRVYHESTNDGSKTGNDGSNEMTDPSSSGSRLDRTLTTTRSGRYYLSTPQFQFIWWDRDCDPRQAVSIWRPVPPAGYAIIGDSIVDGLDPPTLGVVVRDDDSGRVANPTSFKKTHLHGKGVDEIFIWYPTAPPGYVALGCIVTKSEIHPSLNSIRCVRMDLVSQTNISKKAVWPVSTSKGSYSCNLWRIENQASTFIAKSDLKQPPSLLAYGLVEGGKGKSMENLTAEFKFGCLSLTLLENLSGMVTPLVDLTLTGMNLAAHGRFNAVNAVLISSVAASTFNAQLEAWEPLVEPFDGIFKFETYDSSNDSPLKVGSRVRITATNVVNVNFTSANTETMIGLTLAWRKHEEHEQQARLAAQFAKDIDDLRIRKASALEQDNTEKVIVENRLGCDLYYKQFKDDFNAIELLKPEEEAVVHWPPPRFPDRLNAVTDTKASRYYVSVHILDATGLILNFNGIKNNFFCALRLVTTKQVTDGQKPFPQSARSRCVRPLLSEKDDNLLGLVNWNEVFIFEVPHQGNTHLEVVITNLSAKAGKGEAVGMISIPIHKEVNSWLSQTCLPQAMQQASSTSAQTFRLQPLRRKGSSNLVNDCSDIGSISLTTMYLISKRHMVVEGDGNDRFDGDEVGFKVAVNPGGPWACIRSILPLTTTLPQELGQPFGLEIAMKEGQKYAVLRSLVTVANNTDIIIEICICPLSLLRSPDTQPGNNSNKSTVVTEEVFENQCYNPLSGWGNRWPTFLMSKDPGRWSTNDYSVSSKDFLEISLPQGWKWTSDWFVDKSQFVDNEGWAYGPNVQSLKWPLSSIKACKRSPADFVRRRRWIRTRQRTSNADLKNRREVVAVLNPGCSASLPWKCSEQKGDLCVQVRPFSVSSKLSYSWGISMLYSTGTSATSSQSNIERSPTSRSFVRQSKSRTTASLFLLNRLDKTEELIKCSPENGSNDCCYFNVIVDDNVLDRQVMSPVYDWKVTVSAPLILENKLPCNAEYILWQKSNDGNNTSGGHGLLSLGSSVHIYSVDIYKPIYLTWLAEGGWETEKELFLVWDPLVDTLPSFFWMRHDQTKRKVRVSVERDFGQTDAAVKAVRFFVPYWVCNDTDFPLAYHLVQIEPSDNTEADTFLLSRAIKAAKQASNPQSSGLKMARQTVHKVVRTLEHLEDTNGVPAMLSPQTYLGKSGFPTFSSKEEEYMLSPGLGIAVTISKNNIFSHGISFSDLDRKEHVDIKAFNSNDEYCRLSSFVDMASERTKVVHFQAHMLFVNRVGQKLWLKQEGSPRHEVILPSGPPKAILWKSSLRTELLKASLDEHNWSCPFSVSGEGVIHVNMKGTYDDAPFYLRAEVVNGVKKSRFLIIFQHVSTLSPYRIENRCMVLPLRIRQAGGTDSSWNLLLPLSSSTFAWEDFSREHLLEVIVDGSDPKKSFTYNIDVLGDQRPSSNLSSPIQALCLSVCKEGTVNVVKITEWMPSNDYGAIVPYGQVALPSTHEHSSYVECDNQVHVIIELADFGLSVVDHTPEELLYLSIQNLIVSYASDLGSGTSRFKLRLDGLQIDNQIPLTPMPVLFRPYGTNQLGTLLKFTMTMQNCGLTDSYIYSYLGIQGPNSSGTVFMVKIHEPVIWRLHEMVHKLNFGRLTASETKDVAIDPIIRIGLLNISEIRFKVSLAMSPTQRPRGVLGFWSSLMTALSNTENMPIRISSRVHQNISMRQSAMISAASSNIRKDLLSQPLQLLYGLDILGNASSALGHMSKGVAALSMDKKFIQSRQRQDHKGSVEDIGDVIREGGGALAKGLFRGVTGILTKPYEGARSSGVEGFVQGVGKGIIGVAAQPVSGVLDLLSKTTEGANAMRMKIAAAITSEEQTLRHRLPRAIGGDKVLQPFDEFRAQGQALLQLAERGSTFSQLELFKVRGKFAFSDAYEDHFNLPKGRVVIITNHRVILLQRKNDSLKEPCSILWDVTWDDLLAIEPKYGKRDHQGSAPSQLVLILRPCQQESKIFESKEVNRVIKCHPKSMQAEEVRSAIQRAKNTYGSKGASIQLQELNTRKVRKPYAGIATGAFGGSGTAIGMFPGFAAPIAIPVMATFGALLGTTAGQAMVDSDAAASSDARHGQRKDSERGLVLTNFSPSSGKIINQLAPVWSDQRTPWSNERQISFWRPLCPNGYIFVGDVLQLSYDPPSSVMVYANKSNGKFIHPTGFDLVWRNPDSRSRDPLTIWMPRAPPGYVSIGCVVVPDYYEPDPSLVCCVRKDAVKMVDFARFPLVRDSRDADKAPCTIWRVRNDAHTFIARRDQQQQPPPQDLAFNVIT